MSSYLADRKDIRNGSIVFKGDEAYHAAQSARRSIGDEVFVIDGEGNGYRNVLEFISKKRVQALILETFTDWNEPTADVTLVAALIKGPRYETAIEKAVELGVSRIIPVQTHHTVIKPPSQQRLGRWGNIAAAAAKQCRRGYAPIVHEPSQLNDVIDSLSEGERFVVAHPGGEPDALEQLPTDSRHVTLLIGPEGGLHDSEMANCVENGALLLDLGPRRLRTETAVTATMALLMHHLGEI